MASLKLLLFDSFPVHSCISQQRMFGFTMQVDPMATLWTSNQWLIDASRLTMQPYHSLTAHTDRSRAVERVLKPILCLSCFKFSVL